MVSFNNIKLHLLALVDKEGWRLSHTGSSDQGTGRRGVKSCSITQGTMLHYSLHTEETQLRTHAQTRTHTHTHSLLGNVLLSPIVGKKLLTRFCKDVHLNCLCSKRIIMAI